MIDWWKELGARDRYILMAGAVLVSALLLYSLAWSPFQSEYARALEANGEKQSLAVWMDEAAQEVKILRAKSGAKSVVSSSEQSLLSLVDRTTKGAGLGPSIRRIEPDGASKVRVWLENAEFDVAARWLVGLRQNHGIRAENASFEGAGEVGRVNARMSLSRREG